MAMIISYANLSVAPLPDLELRHLAALEWAVGAPVFDRPGGPRAVELTPLGEVLLGHARDVLARVDATARDLERFRAGETGTLAVGTFQSASTAILPEVVGRLRADHPDVKIRLTESDLDDELWDRLGAGELDVSFVVGDVPEAFEARRLLADPFVLIAPSGEFPAGPVAVEDFVHRPQIGQQDNSCQRLNEAGLRAAGGEPRYVFRTNDNGAVVAMVRNGMGVAVLPVLCVDPGAHDVAIHPIVPAIPSRVISIAWRAGRTLSPIAERFIDLAIEAGRRVGERV